MNLFKYIESSDIESIKKLMDENDLVLDGTRLVPRNEASLKKLNSKASFWDQRQYSR